MIHCNECSHPLSEHKDNGGCRHVFRDLSVCLCEKRDLKPPTDMDLRLQAALTRAKEQRTKALKRAARAEEALEKEKRSRWHYQAERDRLLKLIEKHNKSFLGSMCPINPKKLVF